MRIEGKIEAIANVEKSRSTNAPIVESGGARSASGDRSND